MAEIRFSPDAPEDLRQTKDYITDDLCNEKAAEHTIETILKNIRMLFGIPSEQDSK